MSATNLTLITEKLIHPQILMSVQKEPVAVLISVLTPLDHSHVPVETGLVSQTIKGRVSVRTFLNSTPSG